MKYALELFFVGVLVAMFALITFAHEEAHAAQCKELGGTPEVHFRFPANSDTVCWGLTGEEQLYSKVSGLQENDYPLWVVAGFSAMFGYMAIVNGREKDE